MWLATERVVALGSFGDPSGNAISMQLAAGPECSFYHDPKYSLEGRLHRRTLEQPKCTSNGFHSGKAALAGFVTQTVLRYGARVG